MIDPDLPDGLDTMYQHMQAVQAMHEINQYAGPMGPLDVIPPMAFPHPMDAPGMIPMPPLPGAAPMIPGANGPLSGFPQRPHSRVDVWAGSNETNTNNTSNFSMAFTRRNSESPDILRPKLAEFQHQTRIGWGGGNVTSNSSSVNATQYNPASSLPQNYPYNPYSYGFNSFGFNPWHQPDMPDHLENRKDIETKITANQPPYYPPPPSGWPAVPRERWTGLAQFNQTGQPLPSEIMAQGVKNIQQIKKEISAQGPPAQGPSPTYQGWPSEQPPGQNAQQWTPSSRRNNWNVHGTQKPDPDAEKSGGDVEKEVDKEKEESKTNTNMNVIKAVLDEVYRQRNNKDISVASIMDAINNKENRYKMQYRYEGNVPPPSWTQQLESMYPKEKKPEPTPQPAEVVVEEVNKTSIPRTGASFRFSSKYVPQNNPAMIQNPRIQPIQNFPFSQNPGVNPQNRGLTQSPEPSARSMSNNQTSASVVQTQDIIKQAIGIAQSGNMAAPNNGGMTDLTELFREGSSTTSTTTQKVITMNVDTEITIQKEGKVHVVNHEQVITMPVNTTTPPPQLPPQNQAGVTMAIMESIPELTKSPDPSETVPAIPVEATLSPSSTFGIIVGIIIGFTIILGPIICILCRVRRRHREKKRKLSAHSTGHKKGDADAMETMLTCDFGDPKPSTSFGVGAKAKVKSFLTKPPLPARPSTELQTLKPKSKTVAAIVH